jgi:hypothetical protein
MALCSSREPFRLVEGLLDSRLSECSLQRPTMATFASHQPRGIFDALIIFMRV